ncbi:GH36-type glycosyl hydrolase domain-containing protein [Spongiimicrobium salis]|uniref:GH36-type glycosyl hydrolase domain-containing protein n=1 Tax=Spongiimicrobium salis TaxID=1667022 RepID=UPI00374CB3C0
MIGPIEGGERFELTTPTQLPNASGFLWNKHMMIHMNCRGYAVAQFMQPEPAKYDHAPNLEAKTFMQPEQPYYAHHPGRFCYIKEESNGALFSIPYAPVKAPLDEYQFSVGKSDLLWTVQKNDLRIEMRLSLPKDEALELWTIKVQNLSNSEKKVSVYPYFPVGYMSWMNQSGAFNEELCGIVCSSVTPYQKYKEYDKIKTLKDKTFLLAKTVPTSYEVNQNTFEGEGGLHYPTGIAQEELSKGDARYETPACILQYRESLDAGEQKTYEFIFGPARTETAIAEIRQRYFTTSNFNQVKKEYAAYISEGETCITINTPEPEFDNFINHWLPRQIFYHGETNRLSTDPQTRNYLQDNMGMGYLKPHIAREVYITALSQQKESGAMPDGILIQKDAELKYINQVPHTDHCVWLPVCLKAYLDETNDYDLLNVVVPFAENQKKATVKEHLDLAMRWLLQNRDERGLNYIDQGDWCDPMNMVGPKGKGVSGWLSLATAYALKVWATICETAGQSDVVEEFRMAANSLNEAVNTHLWDGKWYARGITDDNVVFGVKDDPEGRIFLNPQAWALLSGGASVEKTKSMLAAVTEHLETPYGVEMLSPSFTAMRDDVGRVTQKHPGSAENGSIYNHAAAFYIFGLFSHGKTEKAYELLRKMIPGPDEADILQRGQLPVFIPNYYRGAYKQFPRTAGRSSQLFNTGTVPWVYRCVLEGLFGLVGHPKGLQIKPQLPKHWTKASAKRLFRGAIFNVQMERGPVHQMEIEVDGKPLKGTILRGIEKGRTYEIKIILGE